MRPYTFFLVFFTYLGAIIPTNVVGEIYDFTKLKELNTDWHLFVDEEELELYQQSQRVHFLMSEYEYLKSAKMAIITGQINLAKHFLRRINTEHKSIRLLQSRYLAIIQFIEEDYKNSLRSIKKIHYAEVTEYQQVCLLSLLTKFPYKIDPGFIKRFSECKSATSNFTINDHYWLNSVLKIKQNKAQEIVGMQEAQLQYIFSNNELIRSWLKLSIFLKREAKVEKFLEKLPSSAYKSDSILELIGIIYYNLKKYSKSEEFLGDLNTPNAENIKGNLELIKGKEELAFGHFMLALKRKGDSVNALERALPLSWKLGKWEKGHEILDSIISTSVKYREKLLFELALATREHRLKYTKKLLIKLRVEFLDVLPEEFHLANSYLSIIQSDENETLKSNYFLCNHFDGLACWVQGATLTWEDLGKTIKRDEMITNESDINLASYKEKKEISPIVESILIDQRDIEELDNNQIGLK